jgi:citrate lyase subunit beta/citryl-CoA lyase
MDATPAPVWRSLLYVPANRPRFVEKAHTRGADAVILDLEDSVPVGERCRARAALPEAVASAGQWGADVLVRVNSEPAQLDADLAALAPRWPRAVVLPKAESAPQVRRVAAWLDAHAARGVGIVALVETALGLRRVDEVAAADRRLLALSLGAEDFAADVGMVVSPETLDLPRQLVLYAARAAGLLPLGLMGSSAEFRDLARVGEAARRAQRFGFEGASCIHPGVVPVLNRASSPGEQEVDEARRIVEAYDAALLRGQGSITVGGRMVDVPVAERARRLLARAARVREIAESRHSGVDP